MAASRSAKSTLFEYCQKRKIGPPQFETWAAANGYQAKVIIDGYPYPNSVVCSKKKDAEHDASNACLASLGVFEDRHNEYNQERGDQGYIGSQGYPGDDRQPGFGTSSPHSEFSTPSPRSFGRPPQNSGSSGGSVKMPKSVLHEFCQSQKLTFPQYETEASYDGNVLLGFNCVLVVNDEYFTTDRLYTNKREAEHAVARKALNVFGYYARSPLMTGNIPNQIPPGTPSFRTPDTSYKNLLQEHLQQRNIETPQYETQLTEGGYFSKVTIEGKTFEAEECCQTKKMAEQIAAKAGLVGMGVKDPEAVATRLLRKNAKGRYKSLEDIPYRKELHDLEPDQLETDQVQGNTSWVHSHKDPKFDVDDYDDIDGEFTDFQKAGPVQLKREHDESGGGNILKTPEQRPNKMQRVGEGSDNNSRPSFEKRPKRRGEFEVEDVHLGNLSVGEAWPEKRNIVIVGSEETSIPLFCQADKDKCALEDVSKGELVDIVPGHRLIGLEGYYVVRGGQIVLRAKQCQQVIMPEQPDKVLISCGVIVLHCIPRRNGNETSCDVNVLLKRYLCSQAFINVVRGLSQYFRCKQSGRSFTLNKDIIVAHIQDWMLEEVMAIASLSENALENVFQHTMKFDKRWGKFLRDEELSKEFKEVQEAANKELFRRANSGEDQNQDRFRPWRLPKGNFYHRILTTGVFIESPPEAAMRELKEETGIKLKLSDVTSSPYVDVPQTDNLNPHKGDFVRYYLCGIITEADDNREEKEEEQHLEESSVNKPGGTTTSANTAQLSTDTTPATTDYPGKNYASTGSAAAVTNSTYNAAYSANAAGYSANTGSAPGGTDSSYGNTGSSDTGKNSMYATGSDYRDTTYANAGAYSAYGSSSTSYTGANTSHAGTNSAYAGSHSSNSDTRSTYGSAYSAYTDAFSAQASSDSTFSNPQSNVVNTNSPYSGTSPDNPPLGSRYAGFSSNTGTAPANTGAFSANTGSTSGYVGTGSNTDRTSTHSGAYSAYVDPYSGSYTNTSLSNTNTNFNQTDPLSVTANANKTQAVVTNIETSSTHHGAYSAYTDPAYNRPKATSGSTDQTSSTNKVTTDQNETKNDSNIKSEKEEESTVIRSPFVSGALHEECKWFNLEEAKEISEIFNNIHNSPEFQKLIAKLKGIVSAM